ncbi:hypothetical protein OTU49_002119 [Cherax quadricarinatus]|uniref:G-protein coupled receptors family 1 profile domain-containing protein n=3 Tax=Cherax quadricarinatus TaxID=27406 RepID=A0AAW0XNW9_CHEQU
MKARRQVVVMLATVTIFFFVSLLPFRVMTLWIVWTPNETIATVGALRYYSMLYTARVMLFANSAVNPILYNLTSSKFRDAFIKLLSNDKRRQRHLSRQSTFNTTGNSLSNGRSGSSRTIPTDLASLKESHPARLALARCIRHSSFDDFPGPRPSMARYGRQSSFAGTYCLPSSSSNSAACSRQNSRAGENGALSALDVRQALECEKRHSGEGRRLLEGDRAAVFTADMIEEERSSGGVTRMESVRKEQQNITKEMEKLLSEEEGSSSGESKCTTSCPGDLVNQTKENQVEPTAEELHNSQEELHNNKAELHNSEEELNNGNTNLAPTLDFVTTEEKAAQDTISSTENGKSVLIPEKLSTRVSVV